jgi:hypothetical protein
MTRDHYITDRCTDAGSGRHRACHRSTATSARPLHRVRFGSGPCCRRPVPAQALQPPSSITHSRLLAATENPYGAFILVGPHCNYDFFALSLRVDADRRDPFGVSFFSCEHTFGLPRHFAVVPGGRLKRCLAEGRDRFELWVGAAVLANNLMRIAALLTARSPRRQRAA